MHNDKYWRIDTDRRKFTSQTSDNMDRWKSRGGKSQRGEEKKWEDQRGEKVRRKKVQVPEKVGKSRFTVFFQWFVAPEGWKVTSLKQRVRSHLARWEMKSCTPLWREAHVQVKLYKTSQPRTTFGSCDVEKGHAVVARSTCPSQNVQNISASDHFWKLRCPFPGHNVQNATCTDHFWRLRWGLAWQARRIAHFVKKEQKSGGLVAVSTTTTNAIRYTTLRYSRLDYTTLHTTPHYTTLHYTTLHYIPVHFTPLHSTPLHCTPLH